MAARVAQKPVLRVVLALGLAVLTLALGWFWFQANFEKKAISVQAPTTFRQWRHPLADAADYLRAGGKQAELRQGMYFFDSLPPPGSMLILRHLPADGRGELWGRLSDWVADGGHLVLAPGWQPGGPEAEFFERAGVIVISAEDAACPQGCDQQENSLDPDSSPLLHAEVEGYPIRLATEDDMPRLRLRPPHQATWRVRGFLQPQASPLVPENAAPARLVPTSADWLLRVSLGAGSLTVLSGMQPLGRGNLNREDNAFLLSALTRGHDRLWLWALGPSDSLYKQLLVAFPFFLASLALLGLCLLWMQQAQLHPRVVPLPATRRDVLVYFDGAGRFAWRANRAAALIRDNREDLARRLHRCRPQDDTDEKAASADRKFAQEEESALRATVYSLQDLVRVSGAMHALTRGMRGRGRGGGRAVHRTQQTKQKKQTKGGAGPPVDH